MPGGSGGGLPGRSGGGFVLTENGAGVPKNKDAVAVLLIVALAVLLYAGTLKNGFVYDDGSVVADNALIRDWRHLGALFSPAYFLRSGEMTYRPVVTLSYFLDYSLWRTNPAGYHLTGLILHALNGALLYLVFRSLTGRPGSALAAALLFVAHPVATEAVDAVSFREDLLAAFFGLLSFLGFLKASASVRGRKGAAGWCFAGFVFALFSKETALILPLLFLLADAGFNRHPPAAAVKKNRAVYAGLSLIAAGYLVVRFFLLRDPDEFHFSAPPFYPRLLTVGRTFAFYLKLLLVPWRLSAEYLYSAASSFLDPRVIFSWLPLFAVAGAGIAAFRRRPGFFFGTGWFLIALLPAANLVPLNNPIAERYLYLPLAGFCLALVAGGEIVRERLPPVGKRLVPAGLVMLIFLYSGRTVFRNRDWRDYLTLSRKTLETCPGSARFHNNLGVVYQDLGRPAEAEAEHRAALAIKPDLAAARNNLGCLYRKQGRMAEAAVELQAALKSDPRDYQAHNNLGLVYAAQKSFAPAEAEYRAALRINPDMAVAHYNLGNLFRDRDRPDEAEAEYRAALELDPAYYQAHNNLGLLLESRGRAEQAIGEYETVLKINPGYAQGHNNLGAAFARKGEYTRAKEHWQKALALDPDLQEAKDNLEELGKIDER